MEGFLRKTSKSKNYYAVVEIEDVYGNKKRKEVSTGTANEKEAKKFLRKLLNDIDEGNSSLSSDKIKLSAYVDTFIRLRKSELEANTIKEYELVLKKHLVPVLGNIYMDKLKPIQLQEYYSFKMQTLSPSTVNKHHRIIKKALKNAVKLGVIKNNPAELVDPPKIPKTSTVGKAIDLSDSKKLLDHINGEPYELPVLLGILCGLRRGEICGLRWSDVNLDNNTITIHQTLIKVNGEYIFKKPKSNDSIRRIQIPSLVMDKMKEVNLKCKKNKLRFGSNYVDLDLVVCHDNGEHINPDWLTRLIPNLTKKLNISKVRLHDLRHTNATIMLEAGVPLKVASDRLGHSSIKITGDLYSHVTKSLDNDASNRINNLFETPTKTPTKNKAN